MANKKKIDCLLLDIHELEKLISEMRDSEVYPVSFFSRTFDLVQKLLNDLHVLEADQVEQLCLQMEKHQQMIQTITRDKLVSQSESDSPEVITEKVEMEPPQLQEMDSGVKIIHEEITNIPVIKETLIEESEKIEQEKQESVVISENILSEDSQIKREELASESPVRSEMSIEELLVEAAEAENREILSLNEILERKNLSDFRKAFSLNDRFRFRRELFGGDDEKMSRVISDLNELQTYEDVVTYLNAKLQWNVEDESVSDFIKLLEKRFL